MAQSIFVFLLSGKAALGLEAGQSRPFDLGGIFRQNGDFGRVIGRFLLELSPKAPAITPQTPKKQLKVLGPSILC
jgi:hypothetical protein